MYKFLLTVWRDSADKTVIYPAGDVDHLTSWTPEQIATAVAAGLIKPISSQPLGKGDADGESVGAPRAHSTRRS